MKKFSLALVLSGLAVLTLAACDTMPRTTVETANGHYWQRAEASSAIWQRGPKAQQKLFTDIARCTNEVKELQRLGAIRAVTPADPDHNGNTPDPETAKGRLAGWETPERDGYLYAEHSDYHDFETCMQFAGWERVEHLPYDVATEARETYVETILTEQRRSRSGEIEKTSIEQGDYVGLND